MSARPHYKLIFFEKWDCAPLGYKTSMFVPTVVEKRALEVADKHVKEADGKPFTRKLVEVRKVVRFDEITIWKEEA